MDTQFAAAWHAKERGRRFGGLLLAAGILILLVCGNGWVVGAMTRHLEWQYLPHDPVPEADCIVVLSGGIEARVPPRPTVEVGDAGDRLLYGAYLFRQRKAPHIICTGNVATGGISRRPVSLEMAEFLGNLGIHDEAIIVETGSENTHEHAKNLFPVLQEKGLKRVLLVTSAMHMPRSMRVFQKLCPGISFIAAPTDFHCTVQPSRRWYRHLVAVIPTPKNLLGFSEAAHEYLGITYYKLRGWI